jgi:hypothetical protein
MKANKGTLPVDDPAMAVAALWKGRGDSVREQLYQGSRKALERFFAMSPVPQSFAEAATAEKLLSKAIDPSSERLQSQGTPVNILAANNFQPKRIIDV